MLSSTGQLMNRDNVYFTRPDDVLSPSAAYSVRLLSSNYKGALVNLRRSIDNATQDFFPTDAGNFPVVQALAFAGIGSLFVTKWYDQSGNLNDAAQATANNQPQFILNLSPNLRPGLSFNGTSQSMVGGTTGLPTGANPLSIIFVGYNSGTGNKLAATYGTTIATQCLELGTNTAGANLAVDNFSVTISQAGLSNSSLNVGGVSGDTVTSTLYINGAAVKSSAQVLNFVASAIRIGTSPGGGNWAGPLEEVYFFSSNLSAANHALISSSARSYYEF